MPAGSSAKRERQYEHIKDSREERGASEGRAQGPTKDQLHSEARKKNIDGRSSMNKDELRRALGR